MLDGTGVSSIHCIDVLYRFWSVVKLGPERSNQAYYKVILLWYTFSSLIFTLGATFLSTDMNGELLVIKHLGVDMIFKKKEEWQHN